MNNTAAKIITIFLVLAVAITGIIFYINNSNRIGDVEGNPYSIKLTDNIFTGPGTWVYYTENGEEEPLNCERAITRITCEDNNKEIVFETILVKNNTPTFPTIKVNGKKETVECVKRFVGADCLTTIN